MNGLLIFKNLSSKVMTHISQLCIFMQMSLCGPFKRNNKKLILYCFMTLVVLTIDVDVWAKAKNVLTGEEAKLFDEWVKTKDGTGYGFGITQSSDLKWLFGVIIAQGLAWLVMFSSKVIDWLKGDKDQVRRDIREVKEALLRLESHSKHWVTDKEVGQKVRDEIKYLRDHKGSV